MAPLTSPPSHRLDLTFSYDDEQVARTIERSLAREVGEIDDDRSETRLVRAGTDIELSIKATDHVSLRAAFNTWCSLADVAEQSIDLGTDAVID